MFELLALYWKPILALISAIALTAYVGIIKHERDNAIQQNGVYKIQVQNLVKVANDYADKIKLQNAAIDEANTQYHVKIKQAELNSINLQKQNNESQQKLIALENYYKSIPNSNECTEIKRILDAEPSTLH